MWPFQCGSVSAAFCAGSFFLPNFSCYLFLLVVLTDFPSQNKILLLNTNWISTQGGKLQHCHNCFFPPVSLAGPCATYFTGWIIVWDAVKIPDLKPWWLSDWVLCEYLKTRQLPGMLCSRGVLELVFKEQSSVYNFLIKKFIFSHFPSALCKDSSIVSFVFLSPSLGCMTTTLCIPTPQQLFLGSGETVCAYH